MFSTDDFIQLAFYLSFLTYYLGTLIYALPIPIYSLKRWGPNLIKDSILTFTLLVSIDFIKNGIIETANIMGSNWEGFYSWTDTTLDFLGQQRLLLIAYYTAFKALKSLILYGDLLGPVIRLISYNMITISFIRISGYFFQSYWFILIAMGIMLISMPFRIGRSAGAWLIALSVVFYIGLPLLPAFAQSLAPPMSQISTHPNNLLNWGISYPVVETGFPYAQPPNNTSFPVEFKVREEAGDTLIARYVSDAGYVDASLAERGLPSNKEFFVYYIIDGISFPAEPYPVDPNSDYTIKESRITLETFSPFILWMNSNYALLYRDSMKIQVDSISVRKTSTYNYIVSLQFHAPNQTYIELRAPDNTQVNIISCDNCNFFSNGKWRWLGLTGTSIRILTTNQAKTSNVIIQFEGRETETPDFSKLEYYYVKDFLGVTTDSIYFIISNIFFQLMFMPILYLAILTLIARQLARLLGSRVFPYIPIRG
ncbi:MAG: hypothetical protein F7B59_04090 [Desulfurococcales archaeon]|nr:hypothetical protein [Desulfurococcales archaeon]